MFRIQPKRVFHSGGVHIASGADGHVNEMISFTLGSRLSAVLGQNTR